MKPIVVEPNATTRGEAYALWMDAPNPMVTLFKTLDVTPLVRLSRRKGLKFNIGVSARRPAASKSFIRFRWGVSCCATIPSPSIPL